VALEKDIVALSAVGSWRRSAGETPGVEATTLDSFATETGLDPDLILVDVEGAEMAVLKGAMGVTRQGRPDLLLEHHGAAYHAALTELLTAEGYRISPVGVRHLLAEHPDRGSRGPVVRARTSH
jgi:hypothetical protein